MAAYKIYLFDDSCTLYTTRDLGVTWPFATTPAATLHDEWSDMTMAINDGDYTTLGLWDENVAAAYNPVYDGQRGGVEITTETTTYSDAILSFSTTPPDSTTELRAVSGAISANGNVILAPGSSGVADFRARISRNRGVTFTDVTGLPDGVYYVRAAFNQNATVMYTWQLYSNCFKSSDSGVTWSQLSASPTISDDELLRLRCSQSGAVVAAAHSSGKIWVSRDGGSTWATTDLAAASGLASPNCVDFGMTPDGSHLVASIGKGDFSFGTGGSGALYTSSDSGVTWTRRTPPTAGAWTLQCVNIAPDGLGVVAVYFTETTIQGATTGFADISTDGGATWTARTFPLSGETAYPGADWVSVYILPLTGGGGPPPGGGGGGGTGPPPPVWTGQAPYLREMTYRRRFLGQSFDPTLVITKNRPGPLRIVEFSAWMT